MTAWTAGQRYSLTISELDGFVFSRWQENAYQMSYSEGSWGLFLTYDVEYLGEDFFLCFGKKFYKADEQT